MHKKIKSVRHFKSSFVEGSLYADVEDINDATYIPRHQFVPIWFPAQGSNGVKILDFRETNLFPAPAIFILVVNEKTIEISHNDGVSSGTVNSNGKFSALSVRGMFKSILEASIFVIKRYN